MELINVPVFEQEDAHAPDLAQVGLEKLRIEYKHPHRPYVLIYSTGTSLTFDLTLLVNWTKYSLRACAIERVMRSVRSSAPVGYVVSTVVLFKDLHYVSYCKSCDGEESYIFFNDLPDTFQTPHRTGTRSGPRPGDFPVSRFFRNWDDVCARCSLLGLQIVMAILERPVA